jgi:hypothetical protein
LCGSVICLGAATVPVSNPSFETPTVPNTVPALPFFEGWQHTPKPDWYVEDPNAPETQWANLAGVFPNPASGQPGRIENTDGTQAGYFFGVPSNGIYQDLNATFEVAQSYQLTAGLVASSTIQPAEGSTVALSLYYRDSNNQIIPVASTNVPYNVTNFPSLTNFVDFSVSTERATRVSDPWAGKKIGVMLVSTAASDKAGGIWDVDNVRVSAFSVVNGSFEAPEVPPTVPALPFLVGWQHTPKPDWYVEDPSAPETAWANLAGVFPNPAPGTPGNIKNIDGKQAAYLFAVPPNGIFQETSATYEAGLSYEVSLGLVASTTIPPAEGSTLTIGLYFSDAQGNQIPLASRDVVYNAANFPSLTNLVYFNATSGPLKNGHPALGKHIGISIVSKVATSGGIWDIDDVQIRESVFALTTSRLASILRISWPARAGTTYQLQKSEDLLNWADLRAPVQAAGTEVLVAEPLDPAGRAFYRVRVVPQ